MKFITVAAGLLLAHSVAGHSGWGGGKGSSGHDDSGKRYCDLISSDQTQLCVVSNPEITPFFGAEFHDPNKQNAGVHEYLLADDANVTLTFDGTYAVSAAFACQSQVSTYGLADFDAASPNRRWACDAADAWADLFSDGYGIEIRGLYYGSNKAYGGLCYNTAICSFKTPSTSAPPNFKLPQPPSSVTPLVGFCPVVTNFTCEVIDDPFVVPFDSLEFDIGLGSFAALISPEVNVTFKTVNDGNGWTLVDSVQLDCLAPIDSVLVLSGSDFVASDGFTTDFFWVCGSIGYVHVILDQNEYNKLGIKSLAYYGNRASSGICYGNPDGTCAKVV
ncbi:hypothetical protein HK100_001516 [Physocladia obscura]|uniref:Uncharacterized protein n=1 Tax=Physocladia obscura TaxID=109957 RepID=A0AAD5XHC6_9FUNG|nr:hypothetical protein HK100_001516 [Physocladia obscura]